MSEAMKYNQLFAGEVYFITPVPLAAGTFAAGDLLVTTDGATWAKATADTVTIDGYFAVCGENVTLEANGSVVAYREGYFNAAVVKVDGTAATSAAVEILKTKNIFIKNVG